MRNALFAIVSLLFFTACSKAPVEYKPAAQAGVGYSDQTTSDKNYDIQVYGYSHTSKQELESIFNRRAAELCGSEQYAKKIKHEQLTRIKDGMLFGANGFPVFIPKSVDKDNFISGSASCK